MTGALRPSQIDALRLWNSPTIANAIETFRIRRNTEGFMDASVRSLHPQAGSFVGYAVTATMRASAPPSELDCPPRALIRELERVPAPRCLVIHDLDAPQPVGAVVGGMEMALCVAAGCVALVTDGAMRDVDRAEVLGLQLFASCLLAGRREAHLMRVGDPVHLGGLLVRCGDLLHGDRHGVVLVPPDIALELPEAARGVERLERILIAAARRPGFSRAGLLRAELRLGLHEATASTRSRIRRLLGPRGRSAREASRRQS